MSHVYKCLPISTTTDVIALQLADQCLEAYNRGETSGDETTNLMRYMKKHYRRKENQ